MFLRKKIKIRIVCFSETKFASAIINVACTCHFIEEQLSQCFNSQSVGAMFMFVILVNH